MDHLQEFCSSRGLALRIDRDAGLLRGVKLLGLVSKNGREYPEATLARAASLYDGAKVNVNHPKGHPLAPRDYQDRLGTIRNVAARPGEGLFGDLQYNPKHALAEQLLWDAEHAPENVGFSHNVQARTAKRGDQTIVEEILAVASVDLVADPATTRGLFEAASPTRPKSQVPSPRSDAGAPCDDETVSVGSTGVASEQRDPVATHGTQQPGAWDLGPGTNADETRQPETTREAEQAAEIERLREQVKTLQAAQAIAHKRAAIAALLVEHGLPPMGRQDPAEQAITSERFIQSLLEASDDGAMRKLVRERAQLVEQASHWNDSRGRVSPTWDRPQSREQTLVESHADDSLAAFIKAIRA
jgi:hypothetical protein